MVCFFFLSLFFIILFFFCSIMKQFFDSIFVYRFKMRINKIVYVILLISLSLSLFKMCSELVYWYTSVKS